jgi:phage shock protein A
MGIFTRFRDIISSNLNAILDRAEDPEKMVRLMIVEMEETLIEIKSACAGVMADQKKLDRQLGDVRAQLADWESKARLAVTKGREDLAKAALVEKRKYAERETAIAGELERIKTTVTSFQNDITQLETKLQDARDKQRSIIQRRAAAVAKQQVNAGVRRVDTSEAFMKFEAYENNIDRMEADARMTDSLRPKGRSLQDEFTQLEHDEEIEGELQRLKKELAGR